MKWSMPLNIDNTAPAHMTQGFSFILLDLIRTVREISSSVKTEGDIRIFW